MRRRGTSLMEVLVAILVMSIGILGVMSLFPIAIARSVEAHRMTNARMLAERADTIIRARGLSSEDVIPQPAPAQFDPGAGTAPDGATHAVIDPLGWHDMSTAFPQFAREYGNDGNAPVRYRMVTMNSAGNRIASPPTQFPQFDPFGITQDILLPNGLGMPDVTDNGRGVPLRRISISVPTLGDLAASGNAGDPIGPYPSVVPLFDPTDRRAIMEAVSLPDTYNTLFSDTPDTTSQVDVRFDATRNDLQHVQTSRLTEGTRVTLFGDSGRKSQVREYPEGGVDVSLNAGEWVVSWGQPLPDGFGPCSEVRIDFPDYRYTWMLTVRKRGVKRGFEAEVDCVVFHNRPTGDPSQELVLPGTQPDPNYGDPRRTDDNGNRIEPNDLVDIEFNNRTFKKGGWVFDPQHCYWYRITDIIDETDTTARLQLARKAHEWIRALIIPEGVVEVFPLDMREKVHTR